MPEVGPGNGIDMVRRMQPSRVLEHVWIISEHVKRVAKWTTMVCHVYEGTYQRVMTIVATTSNLKTMMFKCFSRISSTTSWFGIES